MRSVRTSLPQSNRSKQASSPGLSPPAGAPIGPVGSPAGAASSPPVEAARSEMRSTPSVQTTSPPRAPTAAPSPAATVTRYGMVPLYQSSKSESASGPSTATRRPSAGASGSTCRSFLSRTTDSVAARSASARWAGESTTLHPVAAYGSCAGSNSPRRNRIDSWRATARSMSASVTRPRSSASVNLATVVLGSSAWSVKLSTPALRAAAWDSAWSSKYCSGSTRLDGASASLHTNSSCPVGAAQRRSSASISGLTWQGRPLTRLYAGITPVAEPEAMAVRKAARSYSCRTRGRRPEEVTQRSSSLL